MTWIIDTNHIFHYVKGTSDGLILSVGALEEKEEVWSTLELFPSL